MTPPRIKSPIVPVAYPIPEAAAAVGMSVTSFERNVKPEIRLIRRGKLVLVPVCELQRWCEENAAMTIGGAA